MAVFCWSSSRGGCGLWKGTVFEPLMRRATYGFSSPSSSSSSSSSPPLLYRQDLHTCNVDRKTCQPAADRNGAASAISWKRRSKAYRMHASSTIKSLLFLSKLFVGPRMDGCMDAWTHGCMGFATTLLSSTTHNHLRPLTHAKFVNQSAATAQCQPASQSVIQSISPAEPTQATPSLRAPGRRRGRAVGAAAAA
ncbi:hypothetical protein BC567DRAFT_28694 [Phyllosticta citribraziliensis]